MSMTESTLDPADAIYDQVVPAGEHWMHRIEAGQHFRIVDLEGNQAADTLFYDAEDPINRYSASDTIQRQGALYLTTGSVLISTLGDELLTIVADTCGRHDTVGGACSRESNTMRYSPHTEHMHACRDIYLTGLTEWGDGLGKRDLSPNINFFMNVPVTPDGKLTFEDGISASGRYVEMRAERSVIGLISNCPQLNNPCNAYNPTPVRVLIWQP
ncbi:MAG: urea amidolyase associated protein UAAP2 [Verrucomicrobiota bacterium]